jgi:hypothetical protein
VRVRMRVLVCVHEAGHKGVNTHTHTHTHPHTHT